MCIAYSKQLEDEALYHHAVKYLLAVNKLYEAIDLLKRHALFRYGKS